MYARMKLLLNMYTRETDFAFATVYIVFSLSLLFVFSFSVEELLAGKRVYRVEVRIHCNNRRNV